MESRLHWPKGWFDATSCRGSRRQRQTNPMPCSWCLRSLARPPAPLRLALDRTRAHRRVSELWAPVSSCHSSLSAPSSLTQDRALLFNSSCCHWIRHSAWERTGALLETGDWFRRGCVYPLLFAIGFDSHITLLSSVQDGFCRAGASVRSHRAGVRGQ